MPDKASYPRFANGEVHDWYRLVHGYTDNLVTDVLHDLQLDSDTTVLDPFCGAGTTLVECKKRGVNALGIEANPSSYFAAKVKTTWNIEPKLLMALAGLAEARFHDYFSRTRLLHSDGTFKYIQQSGMLERGWISQRPLEKVIAVKHAIQSMCLPVRYARALLLALITELVKQASNVKFGPELYCGPKKKDVAVLRGFKERVLRMAQDLEVACTGTQGHADVILGDARYCSMLLNRKGRRQFDAVITSPPYPTEHDYTRNARLELALLELVDGNAAVRRIKQTMIRSHTKGIYKQDNDAQLVKGNAVIDRLANKIDSRAKKKTHGFARLYSRVLREYFGGMKRHLIDVRKVLKRDAILVYVIGDQASYLRVHIPTADILGSIAEEVGFERVAVRRWRGRLATVTSRTISENILYLRR